MKDIKISKIPWKIDIRATPPHIFSEGAPASPQVSIKVGDSQILSSVPETEIAVHGFEEVFVNHVSELMRDRINYLRNQPEK